MIRVAHVVESFAYGTAKTVTQICEAQSGDIESTIFYGDRQGTDLDLIDLGPSVRYERLPGRGPLRHPGNIRFLAGRLPDFDVVHAHSSYGGLYGKWLARRLFGDDADRRVLYSPHGLAFLRRDVSRLGRRLIHLFERRSSTRCTTLACGPYEARLMRSWPGEVLCIPNGHDVETPTPVQSLDRTVLGVGRICPQKGFDIFCEVAARCPGRPFRWIGEVQRPGDPPPAVPANVRLTPYLPHGELLEIIRRSRLIFLPSRWEGLSRFLVEGVCLGKAVVTSVFPANGDCLAGSAAAFDDVAGTDGDYADVRRYDNGYTAQSVRGYAAAIEAMDDDRRLTTMQAASHRLAAERYDIRQIAETWRQTYRHAAATTSDDPVRRSPGPPKDRSQETSAWHDSAGSFQGRAVAETHPGTAPRSRSEDAPETRPSSPADLGNAPSF